MVAPFTQQTIPTHTPHKPIAKHERHKALYFSDGSVTLLAENTLFKVHRAWLQRCSSAFQTVLSLPIAPTGMEEGLSDDLPVELQVSASDLERFLYVLYPPIVGSFEPCSLHEWMSVCRVASMFDAQPIRTLAIREMGALCYEPVQRIVLAQMFDITSWLVPAYGQLVAREAPLSVDEGKVLGVETAVRIAQARERYHALLNRRSTGKGTCAPFDTTQIVLSVFGKGVARTVE